MVETIESKGRSRAVRIGSTIGVVVAGALVAFGFARANDDRVPATKTPPTIGVIQSPADVHTSQAVVGAPTGSPATTEDVPVAPPNGTVDVAFPPVSSDITKP